MDDLLGLTIRGYELRERVAMGGHGAVYRAYQPSLDREVAVKVILPQLANQPDFVQRFDREAHLVARLEHPHIVPLYDYWHEPDRRAFLAMRWMSGGSLRGMLRSGALPLPVAEQVVRQIGDALAFAHSKRVIHRDLKPDNVLRDEKGNAYLSDFGIAKDLLSSNRITSAASGPPATFPYASPEQIVGQPATPQTDIYSFAVMLFECLAGHLPFPDRPLQHLYSPIPSLNAIRSEVSPEMDAVLLCATAKEPMQRFATMQDFVTAFDAALKVITVPIPPAASADVPTPPVTLVDPKMTKFALLIHCPQDDPIADRVRDGLVAAGIGVWVDHIHLTSKEDQVAAIPAKLRTCEEGLVILSPRSVHAEDCRAQWNALLDQQKRVFAVLVEDVAPTSLPARLSATPQIDLRSDFAAGMRELVERIREGRSAAEDRTPVFEAGTYSPGAQSALLIETSDDVPAHPRKLIGRDSLLAEITSLLDQQERVLLQGLGGMGKTTLAAEAVEQWIGADKGAVLWLRAGSESAPTLFEALARPFDAHPLIASLTPEQQPSAVRKLLNDHQIKLVVLDDAWEGAALNEAVDALPPSLPLLVTSRQRFPLDVILDVGALEQARAVELLGYHARQPFSDASAETLCKHLGYHPFALKIAGETLKVERITPEMLMQRFAEDPHNMKMPAGFAQEGRESVKSLLDVSVNALDSSTRDVFLTFGALFVPEATPELIALCLKRDPAVVTVALDALQQHGLAERLPVQASAVAAYRLHDLAYAYARANTWLSREEAIAFCRAFVTQHKDNLSLLDAERSNILGAARAAQKSDDTTSLIAIMRALTMDSGYSEARGHDALLLEQLDNAIEAAKQLEPEQNDTLHGMLEVRGGHYAARNDLNNALECYQAALQLAPNPHREAMVLCVIGTVRFRQEADDYNEYFDQAADIAQNHSDDQVLGQVLEARGICARERGELETAHQFLKDAAEVFERTQHPRLALCLYNLGLAEFDLGHFTEALSIHQRAYQIAQKSDDLYVLANAQSGIACVYHALGDRDKARAYFDEALALYHKVGAITHVEWVLRFLEKEGYSV